MTRKINLITAVFLITLTIFVTHAASIPSVNINTPDSVENDFDVVIEIETVENIDSGSFDLLFDQNAVSVESVDDGSIDGTAVPIADWNADGGKLTVLFNLPGVDGASGSGSLATVHFKTIVPGECTIQITEGLLVDTMAVRIPAIWDGVEDDAPLDTTATTETTTATEKGSDTVKGSDTEEGPGFGVLLSICVCILASTALMLRKK